jgi:hypothetical protein
MLPVKDIYDAGPAFKASQACAWTVAKVIKEAVEDFKKAFAVNPALYTSGQFQLYDATRDALWWKVKTEFTRVGSVDPEVQAAFDRFWDDRLEPTKADAVLSTIVRKSLKETYPETVKVFSPDPHATMAWANGVFNRLWGSNAIPVALTIPDPTAAKVRVAYQREASACHDTALRMARRLLAARGSTLTSNPSNFAAERIAGALPRDEPEGRQTLVYNHGQLDTAVDRIKAAMSRGYLYLIGVLSGLTHRDHGRIFPTPDQNPRDPRVGPEHWLLFFKHDDADTFVFWDSDAPVTHIGNLPWGPGFGLLFHKFGRFSTAWDDADFHELSDQGDHDSNQRRHRYQAYLAAPIP